MEKVIWGLGCLLYFNFHLQLDDRALNSQSTVNYSPSNQRVRYQDQTRPRRVPSSIFKRRPRLLTSYKIGEKNNRMNQDAKNVFESDARSSRINSSLYFFLFNVLNK